MYGSRPPHLSYLILESTLLDVNLSSQVQLFIFEVHRTQSSIKHFFKGSMLQNRICFDLHWRLTSKTDCRITILMFRIWQPIIYKTNNHFHDVKASSSGNNVLAKNVSHCSISRFQTDSSIFIFSIRMKKENQTSY